MAHADPSLTPPDERDLPPPPNASTSIGLAANTGSGVAGAGTTTAGAGVGGTGGHHEPRVLTAPTPRDVTDRQGVNKRSHSNALPAGKQGGPVEAMSSMVSALDTGAGLESTDGHSSTLLELSLIHI